MPSPGAVRSGGAVRESATLRPVDWSEAAKDKERSRFRRIAGKVFIPVIRAFRQISIHLNSDGRAPRDMKHAKNRADAPAFVGSA